MKAKIPASGEEFIEMLDVMAPEKAPNPDDSDREVWMKAGERRLVNKLKAMLEADERKGLI